MMKLIFEIDTSAALGFVMLRTYFTNILSCTNGLYAGWPKRGLKLLSQSKLRNPVLSCGYAGLNPHSIIVFSILTPYKYFVNLKSNLRNVKK